MTLAHLQGHAAEDMAVTSSNTRRPNLESEELARRIADLTLERKALNVVVLDVRGRSSYTDFLVIASGTSDRHVQGIAEIVEETLRQSAMRPIGHEGLREGQWALVDFGSVVLHVFHQFTRDVYDLEALWRDAPRLALAAPVTAEGH